ATQEHEEEDEGRRRRGHRRRDRTPAGAQAGRHPGAAGTARAHGGGATRAHGDAPAVRIYLLLMAIAAVVTFLATPMARVLALRTHAITAVRARDVHTVPIPRLGGVAMLAGFAVTLVIASQMPFLQPLFAPPRGDLPWAILISATVVCLLGVADDIWDLDWLTKMVGQVLAAGF